MCCWRRCRSLSFHSFRPHALLLWDSSSWSWACHLSSLTGRLESPGVEVDISRHDWPRNTTNRMPTKAFPFIKLPLIWRVLGQNQIGKFGCTKWRICEEPSPCSKKQKQTKESVLTRDGADKSPCNGGENTDEKQCVLTIKPMSHLSARLFGGVCRNVKDSKKDEWEQHDSKTEIPF